MQEQVHRPAGLQTIARLPSWYRLPRWTAQRFASAAFLHSSPSCLQGHQVPLNWQVTTTSAQVFFHCFTARPGRKLPLLAAEHLQMLAEHLRSVSCSFLGSRGLTVSGCRVLPASIGPEMYLSTSTAAGGDTQPWQSLQR